MSGYSEAFLNASDLTLVLDCAIGFVSWWILVLKQVTLVGRLEMSKFRKQSFLNVARADWKPSDNLSRHYSQTDTSMAKGGRAIYALVSSVSSTFL